MMHFAYPTVKADSYSGCGRYVALLSSQPREGYTVADPEPGEVSEITTAAALLAPESSDSEYEIYEMKDGPSVLSRGASLGLAYLLALISRSRRLRLDRLDESWLFRSLSSVCVHAAFSSTLYESALSSRASQSTKRQ
jgi:hypothetical protein